ncbi:unnamed protein product [Clavelina lepadiformis]|uniref:VWFA domain-containing protein n=1 Tax=Clavelina lepadiformis TaxID=159417 RepID=A0ABP0G7Z2_CLALP
MRFMNTFFFLLLDVFFCCQCFDVVTSSERHYHDAEALSKKIQTLTEFSLKYTYMQNHFDQLDFITRHLHGQDLLDSLSRTFQSKFSECNAAVRELRNAVLSSQQDERNLAEDRPCCELQEDRLDYNAQFKTQVALNMSCYRAAKTATKKSGLLSKGFTETCLRNMRAVDSLKWQYFGSEAGFTIRFPAKAEIDCASSDDRSRPWYVQANSRKPKQVVIVIDRSKSMSNILNGTTRLELAKAAAKTVIDTLSTADKFAVIAFSYFAKALTGGCFSNGLSQATPRNKDQVKEAIDDLDTSGQSIYTNPVQLAFDMLKDEHDLQTDEGSYKVILFFTEDDPADVNPSDILETMREKNAQMNNSVVMMTYGFGNGNYSLLKKMVARNYGLSAENEVGDIVEGKFTLMNDTDLLTLKNQMASYYLHFAEGSQNADEPFWTAPYSDAWGLGETVTASLPVYDVRNRLLGVVAVDLTIEEILEESTYFRPNEFSYSFIIDDKGFVINHPLFPHVTDNQPLLVFATSLERDPQFLAVFESMKKGESGSKTFISTRVLPQGDSRSYGVQELKVESVYSWKRIKNTGFSICLVLALNDTQSMLKRLKPGLPLTRSFSFLYHRLDLLPPPSPCSHHDTYSSMDESSVFLASRAFEEPNDYLQRNFTLADVKTIESFMTTGKIIGGSTPKIKSEVRNEVIATYRADELWTSGRRENGELEAQVLWRYIGTNSGLYRIFPGTQMPKDYDPSLRPWFEHALANRNINSITPPYEDAATGDVVVTLSRVIFEGRKNEVHDWRTDDVVAVMGVDIVLDYFQTILQQLYPACNGSYRCLIIDKAGYVITSDEYVDVTKKDKLFFEKKHVVEVAPNLAASLISGGVLNPISCSNVKAASLQRAYQIAANQGVYSGISAGRNCNAFRLLPIANTNIYLLVQYPDEAVSCRFSACTCIKIGTRRCESTWKGNFCECPCEEYPDPRYVPCQNQYNVSGNSNPPCTPENPELSSISSNKVKLNDLPSCYEIAFHRTTTPTVPTLPSGQQESCQPTKVSGSQSPSKAGIIVGAVVGVIVFIAICVGMVLLIRKCRPCSKQTSKAKPVARTASVISPIYVNTPFGNPINVPPPYDSQDRNSP